MMMEQAQDDQDEIIVGIYDLPSALSDRQEVALVFLPIVPSILSICGSACIIHMVVRDKKRDDPYKRLLFGLSICDIIYSTTFAIQTFLIPKDDGNDDGNNTSSQSPPGGRPFAMGNEATCTVSGFLFQLGVSQLLYYAMLSHYFLFIIRFGWKRRDFAKRIEPMMHIWAIGWPLGTAIAGAIIGVYDQLELDNGCWIDNYPKGCYSSCIDKNIPEGCADSCISGTIGWIAAGMWFVWVWVSTIIINIVIYIYVRKTTKRVERRGSFLSGHKRPTERLRTVAVQAFLYVAALFATYAWTLILQILETHWYTRSVEGQKIYILLVLQALLRPMGGLFNVAIYIRPKFLHCRKRYPTQSIKWCLYSAMYGIPDGPGGRGRRPVVQSEITEYTGISDIWNRVARMSRMGSAGSASRMFSFPSFRGMKKPDDHGNKNAKTHSNNDNDLHHHPTTTPTTTPVEQRLEQQRGNNNNMNKSVMSSIDSDYSLDDIDEEDGNNDDEHFDNHKNHHSLSPPILEEFHLSSYDSEQNHEMEELENLDDYSIPLNDNEDDDGDFYNDTASVDVADDTMTNDSNVIQQQGDPSPSAPSKATAPTTPSIIPLSLRDALNFRSSTISETTIHA